MTTAHATREHLPRGRPRTSRTDTVSRVQELIEQQHWPLRLVDLCRAAGVSERTLRTIIREQFDLGPSRYLRLRRLQMLHGALSRADPGGSTVASVAARFGYSHGGRMASEYQALFGEYPSQTLGRAFTEADAQGEDSAAASTGETASGMGPRV
ncbi:MAG TPA: helix-turn-helix domain-containing protein [Lysobacter sp.]